MVVKEHEANLNVELFMALISVGVAASGILLARKFYVLSPGKPMELARAWPKTYNLLFNKYWVDEIYDVVFVRGTKKVSAILFWFDSHIVDGMVNGMGWLVRMLVWIDGKFDQWVVDGLVNLLANSTAALGRKLRKVQTGQLQTYLGTLAGVFVALSLIWMTWMLG